MTDQTQTFTDNPLGREALRGNERVISESREQARETPEPLTPMQHLDFLSGHHYHQVYGGGSDGADHIEPIYAALRAATPDPAEPRLRGAAQHLAAHDLIDAATPDPAEPRCDFDCDACRADADPEASIGPLTVEFAPAPAEPVHVYAGENLARCGAEVGDPCAACTTPDPAEPGLDVERLVARGMHQVNNEWAMSEYNAPIVDWDGQSFLDEARDLIALARSEEPT